MLFIWNFLRHKQNKGYICMGLVIDHYATSIMSPFTSDAVSRVTPPLETISHLVSLPDGFYDGTVSWEPFPSSAWNRHIQQCLCSSCADPISLTAWNEKCLEGREWLTNLTLSVFCHYCVMSQNGELLHLSSWEVKSPQHSVNMFLSVCAFVCVCVWVLRMESRSTYLVSNRRCFDSESKDSIYEIQKSIEPHTGNHLEIT